MFTLKLVLIIVLVALVLGAIILYRLYRGKDTRDVVKDEINDMVEDVKEFTEDVVDEVKEKYDDVVKPTLKSTKSDIIAYLDKVGAEYKKSATKEELMKIVKKIKK